MKGKKGMGQKVNSNSLRFGLNKNWVSRWNSRSQLRSKNFGFLIQNERVWLLLKKECMDAGVGHIEMERFLYSENREAYHVFLHVTQPAFILGNLKFYNDLIKKIQRIVGRNVEVQLKILELKNPNVSAVIIASEIVSAIKNRLPHSFLTKKLVRKTMISGALGVKVKISGRINGVEIARNEMYSEGSVPLSTLRADIDYCFDYVKTKYGVIGVKVWVNRGLYFGKYFMPLPAASKNIRNRDRDRDNFISSTY